jgi:transcription initiation factor TFIID subunit 10
MAANPPTENSEQMAAPAAGPNGTQPTSEAAAGGANASAAVLPAPESRLPTRKDASLKEFMNKMDDYAPIVSRASEFPPVEGVHADTIG